jgi:thiol:disulfide interchange protein DsbD
MFLNARPLDRQPLQRRLLALFSGLIVFTLLALSGIRAAHADEDFLEPDAAFHFSARMVDGHTIAVTYQIADGYYMYRERFKFDATGAKLGAPAIPPGKIKFDETFQKNEETYRKNVTITIPVEASGGFTLRSTGQGCSDKGLCYAPMEAKMSLTGDGSAPAAATPATVATNAKAVPAAIDALLASGADKASAVKLAPVTPGVAVNAVPKAEATVIDRTREAAAPVAASAAPPSDSGRVEAALKSGKLLVILPLFALLGLGLSFTPCVLPMVPILSSIIVGEGDRASRSRGLLLSVAYALGMAIVYTALGVAAGLAGEGLAATLQNPWVLGTFALLMAVLSLSMFGFYELQVPGALQSKLTTASNRQSSGKLAGVFVMGAISALIVGPCVAAPLAGALLYISQTRDVVIGGSALFALAVGMSVPLLLVGI